jgi:hypothetical protein
MVIVQFLLNYRLSNGFDCISQRAWVDLKLPVNPPGKDIRRLRPVLKPGLSMNW